MVIKEMSSMGADVKAGNELDFREIFRDSRQFKIHITIIIRDSKQYSQLEIWGPSASRPRLLAGGPLYFILRDRSDPRGDWIVC